MELDEDLKKKIPISHVYPIDAKQGTKFPFCVIQRTGIQDTFCKDGVYQDIINVTLMIVDDNYINSIEIANEIRNWLEGHRYKDDTIDICRIQLNSASETMYNNAFIQTLSFNITIN